MTKQELEKNQIVIYKTSDNEVELRVKMEKETIWLSQKNIAELFDVNVRTVNEHLQNIFKTAELTETSVIRKFRITATDGKKYDTKHYNLDAIISVGYRVNSKKATQFRVWATSVLKNYITQGYALNENRLKEAQEKFVTLQETINFLSEKSKREIIQGQEIEILNLLKNYSKSLTVLNQFDKKNLPEPKGKKAKFTLEYKESRVVIEEIKKELIKKEEAGYLFGKEKEKGEFSGIIKNLYPTIETKAAHLLYFIIKDHPFVDGNKRSASFLFVYFLDKNNSLYKETGEKKINDNALATLALLVAISDPKEKEIMIQLIMNLLA